MPRVKPHHHPCQDCGAKTECGGTWEENYDGWPEVICPEFHDVQTGLLNGDFVCEGCQWKRDDHAAELRKEEQRKEEQVLWERDNH